MTPTDKQRRQLNQMHAGHHLLSAALPPLPQDRHRRAISGLMSIYMALVTAALRPMRKTPERPI